jgi:Ser/Thr protein kinase RdoA (MazF antagonist)
MEYIYIMNEFNQRFERLSESQKQVRYQQLALACLVYYPAVDGKVTFVAHNAGIVYLIETAHRKFLLKIAEAIGEGGSYTYPEYLNTGFTWLNAIARETSLIVQQPVANPLGAFVTTVTFEDLSQPFYCSLQHWLDGQRLRDPSPAQAYQIGEMMAHIHHHGSQWIQARTPGAWKYDGAWLSENLEGFAKVKSLAILSEAEWINVEKAVDRIQQVMQTIGTDAHVWGPIHGDIHQHNLIVLDTDKICPIDFGALVLAHYGYDLGVTLYHLMYLDATTRQALVNGYKANRDLSGLIDMGLEAFLCMAALANLGFNVELPDQRTSALFIRNVREFAAICCHKLIQDIPFALQYYDYIR